MSRSGYVDDGCDHLELYRASVDRAIRGRRGQIFLRELAKEMDEMPIKKLIAYELVSGQGEVCAIGVVCKARGIDTENIDIYDPESVGRLVNISRSMAAEIEYENDERGSSETAENRWIRMRKWVDDNTLTEGAHSK